MSRGIGPPDRADARHVIGMTPEERAEVFVGLDRTMEAILANLLPEDRRRQVSRLLDPRPTPWWKNLRRSVWPHDDAAPELPPLADVVLRLTDVFKLLGRALRYR